jgi:hypothetical protein
LHTPIVGATTACSKWNNDIFNFTDGLPGHRGLEPPAPVCRVASPRGGLRAFCVAVIYRS